MGIRLCDSTGVILREFGAQQQVRKDQANAAVFHAGGFRYDVDGRAFCFNEAVPEILRMLSIADARAI
ncbi:hypothetical protein [Asticcacaulis benevestitus]|uniref:Uncharacterized protein n=1 Tax=Asticcacaulis benevestitus DSM 16100 = ATCC BAA-896 TaxID=1121022 RepID=V4NZ31_9CAUL|nr:hypothetical protein [Asticcacaulis benevestitus]ESQ87027.1 hypothetical protein ABENE_17510 [Asticcacaulis benevestitus DSM 16100 = ATCC BAA-896]